MIRETLSNLHESGLFGTLSTVLFLFVFVGAFLWVAVLNKKHVNKMSHMPLEASENFDTQGDKNHV